jgi:uncharacterized membrane protein
VSATTTAPTFRRRFDSQVLRWQARLDSDMADRVLPWVLAGILAIAYLVLAESRYRGTGGSPDLAQYLQARWLILHGEAPEMTINGTHLLAHHMPLGFYPLAWITRVIPAVPTLLGFQAISLAFGAVPLWRLARDTAKLRTGAALALVVAYGASPTLNNLNLAGFHPASLAVAPLLGATYLALHKRWRAFALLSLIALLWSAELGLVIAGLGLLLFMRGERRIGKRTIVAGVAWTLIAVLVVEPHFGNAGFIAPGAFHVYGDSTVSVAVGMLTHPFRVLGDLLAEENVRLLVVLLAPLLFLPVLSPRYLVPAIPLQALYLIADVPKQDNEVGLPITVFAFVAATFALSRMGRRGVERVAVDRRVLIALTVAALGFFATDAVDSPYQRPWQWGREEASDHARHDAARLVGETTSVRASPSVLSLVAERHRVYVLSDLPDPAAATAGDVDRVVIDSSTLAWTPLQWLDFSVGMVGRGYRVIYRDAGVVLYARGGS